MWKRQVLSEYTNNRAWRLFTSKINKNIAYYMIYKYSNFVNDLEDPKNPKDDQDLKKGTYVNDDDQDWGNGGMNDVQEDSE